MRASSAKTSNDAVRVSGLSVTLQNSVIIDDVSFAVAKGSMTAIIGPNGSGKTTLLRAMLGLVPHTGDVAFFGAARHDMRRRIGYVPQRFDFDRTFPITVREFLNLARQPQTSTEHMGHTLREVGLPLSVLSARVGTLSGGQLQRVLIAQAILNNPDILFLDEPATGIDVTGEEAVMQVLTHLKETHGTTIIIVSHDLGMIAESVDHVVCINHTVICAGTPEKTMTAPHLAKLYGNHTKPVHHHH